MKKKLNLSEKSVSELTDLLKERREEVRTLRFSIAGGRAMDGTAAKKARADVARIMTELGSRARQEATA